MSRCHHDWPIKDSWMECPKCCAEHDLREAADTARDILQETRRQNSIREDIASSSSAVSDKDSAQHKASFAEERLRMGDLRGAVQLITDAIALDPKFLSFYLQRAKYLVRQDKGDKALSDLCHVFTADPEILVEMENQQKAGRLNEFAPIKNDLEVTIKGFRKTARETAIRSLAETEKEIKRMREAFSQKNWPDFVKKADDEYQRLIAIAQSDSYLDLLQMPKRAQENLKAASEAIKMSPSELEKKRLYELKKKTEEVLKSISTTYKNESAEADVLFGEAEYLVKESKKKLAVDSIDAYTEALALAREATNNLNFALLFRSLTNALAKV